MSEEEKRKRKKEILKEIFNEVKQLERNEKKQGCPHE